MKFFLIVEKINNMIYSQMKQDGKEKVFFNILKQNNITWN